MGSWKSITLYLVLELSMIVATGKNRQIIDQVHCLNVLYSEYQKKKKIIRKDVKKTLTQ